MTARCCSTPRCPHPSLPGGRCARCKAKAEAARNQRRTTSRDVYLSKRWRKLRRLVLDEEPYCQQGDCQAPSAEVDHVIRIEVGGHPWDRANLMAMCGPHHSAKTAAETGFGGRHD